MNSTNKLSTALFIVTIILLIAMPLSVVSDASRILTMPMIHVFIVTTYAYFISLIPIKKWYNDIWFAYWTRKYLNDDDSSKLPNKYAKLLTNVRYGVS